MFSTEQVKFFATTELVELMKERNWLARVTIAINQHWHRKNAICKRHASKGAPIEPTAPADFAEADG
jgi:hypothetical protein